LQLSFRNQRTDIWRVNTCADTSTAGAEVGSGACTAFLAVPFIGEALFGACLVVTAAPAVTAENICWRNCDNIGSPCCPISCGPELFCCFEGETCLDSGKGLCCSAGTLPCYGARESCYDPGTETCMLSGLDCPTGLACGDNCCDLTEICADGNCITNCASFGAVLCGSECCDEDTGQCIDGVCCPIAQACGETCCPGWDDGTCCGGSASLRPGYTCCGIPSGRCPPPR
jgi:hypothetical protein